MVLSTIWFDFVCIFFIGAAGVDFIVKTMRINERNVAVQLWDTAGKTFHWNWNQIQLQSARVCVCGMKQGRSASAPWLDPTSARPTESCCSSTSPASRRSSISVTGWSVSATATSPASRWSCAGPKPTSDRPLRATGSPAWRRITPLAWPGSSRPATWKPAPKREPTSSRLLFLSPGSVWIRFPSFPLSSIWNRGERELFKRSYYDHDDDQWPMIIGQLRQMMIAQDQEVETSPLRLAENQPQMASCCSSGRSKNRCT